MKINYSVGDKIKFRKEKQRYTVQACDERFLICTKPFNARKTVLYTIVDLQKKIRGPDFWTFGKYEYSKISECKRALKDLNSGETEISSRHRCPLDIEGVKND